MKFPKTLNGHSVIGWIPTRNACDHIAIVLDDRTNTYIVGRWWLELGATWSQALYDIPTAKAAVAVALARAWPR